MISVVVPIYKVEAYLRRCIDSIINQTYDDIEIILINDGSPDECPQICDEYAQKDKRIKVIHKENGGLSDARNAGLEIASGDFVTFVDSDDFIHPDMLRHLFENMVQYDADISSCEAMFINNDDNIDISSNDTESGATCIAMTGIEAMEAYFLGNKDVPVMSCAKLYSAKLFTETRIRFPVGRIHEDDFTTYLLFFNSKKIFFSNKELYYNIKRSDSITGQPFYPANLDVLEAARQAIKFVEEENLPLIGQAYHWYLSVSFAMINKILKEGSYRKWLDILKELRTNILDFAPKTRGCRHITLNQRIGTFLLRLGLLPYLGGKRIHLFLLNVFCILRK